MSLTVKAFLYRRSWKEEPQEIRRFSLDQDVSTSYSYLVQKLAQVFPSVPAEDIVLSWADADGDHITISSDDELLEALDHFDGSIFKIHLRRQEKLRAFYCPQPVLCTPPCCPSQNSTTQSKAGGDEQMEEGATSEQPPSSGADPQPQQGEGPEHVGVICDGCSSGIFGVRYKCLVCPDYDLCSSCEKQGKHVDHNMVTIKDPHTFNPWGFPGGLRRGGPCRGRGRYHCHGGRGRPGPQWLSPYFLQHMMGQWGQGGNSSPKPPQEKQSQGKSEEMEAEQPTSRSTPSPEDAQLEKEQRQSYLQDIGEAVSTFLHPFGVKVDVGVVDGGTPKGETDDESAPSAPSKVPSGYDGNTLYPTLDSATTGTDPAGTGETPTPAPGAEDTVEAVITQLRGMGFDNDGGWLTELVRAKGGDIGKVLDALHPSQSD